MRRIYLILVFVLWISCYKIEPPYTQSNNNLAERTVLIEKFTGHKCSNCPEASRKVDELQEFYWNNLILIKKRMSESQLKTFEKSYNEKLEFGKLINSNSLKKKP